MAALHRPALPLPSTGRLTRTWGKQLASRRWWIIAVGLLLAAAVLQVNQFSRVTSTGYDIEALRREHTMRQAYNNELKAEVAQLSSLARIDWEARTRLAMEPATRRVYITVNHPLPEGGTVPERFRPQQPAAGQTAEPQQPLWRRLAGGIVPFD